MADAPKTSYTLAEVREECREAFESGAYWCRKYRTERDLLPISAEIDAESARRYPAPTKPREMDVVTTSGYVMRFRVVNGELQQRQHENGQPTWGVPAFSATAIRELNHLLAHPEEPADA